MASPKAGGTSGDDIQRRLEQTRVMLAVEESQAAQLLKTVSKEKKLLKSMRAQLPASSAKLQRQQKIVENLALQHHQEHARAETLRSELRQMCQDLQEFGILDANISFAKNAKSPKSHAPGPSQNTRRRRTKLQQRKQFDTAGSSLAVSSSSTS